jgi:phosphoglycolate phosphatase
MDFKAVIFDLDGTLLDTLEDLADAMNAVLQNNRLPVHDVAAYRYFIGDGIDMLVRRALPFEIADEQALERFIREMKSEYAVRWTQKTRLYPGILDVLGAFSAAGFELAVFSNKPDEATQHIVQAFLPGFPFRLVIGATSGKPKKPDPTVALEIADRLRIAPARFIYVGDTAIDMRTAVAAGMFPVGVLWGFRPAEELIAAGAELLVSKPASLLPWVSRAAASGP